MMNVICLTGRLVRDPELKTTTSGANVVSFTVAVERNVKGRDGNRETDFFDVAAWNKTADFVYKYFRKGAMIAVNGSLQTRTYQAQDGSKRKAFTVHADNVHFCGSKADAPAETQGDADASAYIPPQQPQQEKQERMNFTAVDDDDLPF